MVDPLLRLRDRFSIPERTTHLVSHSMGAMPRAVPERLRAFAEQWAARGVRVWGEGWWTIALDAGDRVARIIGAGPGTVVMMPNVSIGFGAILSSLDWPALGRRNKVVVSALDFPTLLYAAEAQSRIGARFEPVPGDTRDPLSFDLERFLAAIDDDTAIVAISAVLFRTSERIALEPIAERARARGALLCVDLYQAAGTLPIDVTRLGADFAVGGSNKWLCGGPGAGYLYVSPSVPRSLAPRLTGWAAHAAPFSFEPPPVRYAEGAARFLNGSPHVAALVAAAPGHEIVLEAGLEAIRAKSTRQTSLLIELCLTRGFTVRTPRDAERRGGSVTVDVRGGAAIVAALAEREILCDFRSDAGVRISPHLYTADGEITRAVDALVELAREAPDPGGETRY